MRNGSAWIAAPARWAALLAVITAAVALRLNADLWRDLWEDEVIAAAHAEHPFWRMPVTVFRLDVHPPLYFMQLHLWRLFGDGDLWLRLNSVVWNLLAVGSVFLVVRRLYGRFEAYAAASLFALSAPAVWMAQEVRPYSWLYCLLIWAFCFVELRFRALSQSGWLIYAIFGLCVAIIHSHALGFVFVFVIGLYSLALLARGGLTGRAFVAWASLYGLCAVSAAPSLVVGLLRDGNLGESAGVFSDLATWIPQLLLPRGGGSGLAVLAGAIYLGVVALGLVARETRLVTAAFLIGPLAVAALAGLAYAQIFKLNIFSTFIMPFFALVAARLLVRLRPARAWVGAGALGTVLCAFSVLFLMNRPPTTGYLAASQLIRSERRAGDVVYVPQPSMFWGMARYMGVERRAWHLEVAPVLTAQWRRMHDRLGAGFVSLFGLEPRTQTLVTREGIELVVGAELPDAAAARWVWLVTYERADLPAGFPPPAIGELRPTLSTTVGFLHIQRYERVH